MSFPVSRKLFYAIACSVSCLLLILAACARRPAAPGSWYVANNQSTKLSDYKGKVVVLDFYATWCEPCRAETPRLVQLQKDLGPSGLQVVGLNVGGDDDRAQVPVYAKEFGVEYPLGFPDDNLVDQYLTDNQDIPQAFVFDRQGDLIKRFVGYSPSSGAELERIVKGALAAGPVARQ
jgi:cytochrome c biogenesis protein CcmG/thiol:disulfide interchange protein DsbE